MHKIELLSEHVDEFISSFIRFFQCEMILSMLPVGAHFFWETITQVGKQAQITVVLSRNNLCALLFSPNSSNANPFQIMIHHLKSLYLKIRYLSS